MSPLDRGTRVFVAGHRGLVGSAIVRQLQRQGFSDLVLRTSAELDLRDRQGVFDFFSSERPQAVVLAAARVGGIEANRSRPVDFITDNLQIQTNVLDAALATEVPRMLFLGSSCIYPRPAPQPIPESALLTGPLESTNDAYAIAKIAGIMQVQAVRRQYGLPWISAMPTNLYGPGDNFDATTSHVVPAMIIRYLEAVESGATSIRNWGSGTPRREFLHVDDMAAACLHLLDHYDADEHVNVGVGSDITIRELAEIIGRRTGFTGQVEWDTSKPDGTPRKLLDVERIFATGWRPAVQLEDGLTETIAWVQQNRAGLRRSRH
ncbi:GDP-L-fucose synthase family protein [Dermacoccaceae bacterium W4C1]